MRQAITVSYKGPTDVKPARLVAKCEARRRVYSWDHALGIEDNYMAAAKKLATELEWHGRWVGGSPVGSTSYVFVWDVNPAHSFDI